MDLQLLIKVKIDINVTGCRIFNFCKNGWFRGIVPFMKNVPGALRVKVETQNLEQIYTAQ